MYFSPTVLSVTAAPCGQSFITSTCVALPDMFDLMHSGSESHCCTSPSLRPLRFLRGPRGFSTCSMTMFRDMPNLF